MADEKISCSIFQNHEPRIKASTDNINRAKTPQEKIRYAERLLNDVNELLDCPEFKKHVLECENCHMITNVRKQTAELIIKTKKLV